MSDDPSAWERRLVARIIAGDERALASAYDQYGAVVYGLARRLVGPDLAADVCQEVFMTLWRHPERWDPTRGTLRTFLVVVGRRRAVDHIRSTERRRANEVRARGGPTTMPNVDEAALAMIDGERVRAALSTLPPAQREAIELAYFDGLTFREVATATGAPEGTAKSRIRLGLQQLDARLRAKVTTP